MSETEQANTDKRSAVFEIMELEPERIVFAYSQPVDNKRRFGPYINHASCGDYQRIEQRVEDALLVGRNTDVAPVYVIRHSRWLAVLEGARAAARTETALT